MASLDPKKRFPQTIGGERPSVAPATVKNVAKQLGMTEAEALKTIEEIVGGPVEVVTPTEPFMVVVTNYKAVPTSKRVVCSLCDAECWAGDDHGPLATYLCMDCAQRDDLNLG